MTLAEQVAILGSVGEFIGSLAVLCTLIYLAVQVNQSKALLEENRRLALSQVFQTRVGFRLKFHTSSADPVHAELLSKIKVSEGIDEAFATYDNLSVVEQYRYRELQAAAVMLSENAIYQYDLGLLTDQQMQSTANFVRTMLPMWEKVNISSESFASFVAKFDEDNV